MSYTGKIISAHFTSQWFVIFLLFSTAFSATTAFFSSFYLPLLLLHAETVQTHIKFPPPQKKTHQTTKNTVLWESSRQASCFCEKHKVGDLLENQVNHDGLYFCSLGANTISNSFPDNPVFLLCPLLFRHCQVWWLLVQPSDISMTIHQEPKHLPAKLSTSG